MFETGALVAKRPSAERKTNAWGVDLNYEDALGKWHEASEQTVRAVLQAMGVKGEETPAHEDEDYVMVATPGRRRKLIAPAEVTLESGETLRVGRQLPAEMPFGYHRLTYLKRDETVRLIVSPGRCFLPEDLETWGWAVQLYAARSRSSWGVGDLADLERLAEWSASKLGARMMLINPLSAVTPIQPQQSSPYYPTSRRFFNPLSIHIEWVPGASAEAVPDLDRLAKAGRELNRERLIDRDKAFELKMAALELLWERFQGDPAFDGFCRAQGPDLHRFATFCVLAETHRCGWHKWPESYRHPDRPEVKRFGEDHRRRVEFHKWLQWLLDVQLERCSKQLALMQDLPIGVDPDGADAWAWQDVFAHGAGVGAPPDEFNTQGQNWGLPPFVPHKLCAASYEPFIQTIRAAFRHGGGLRIDHVMGLFRLFWIPQGMSAAQGTYVRYNADDMLSIVALESQRAGAYVVGEDLGTVEEEAREKLARYRVLSYRLLWFEKEHPSSFPREALAAITTHDLPTVAGIWTGSDLQKQRDLNLNPNEESTQEICTRLTQAAGLRADAPIEEVVTRAYGLLSAAPCRILTAALDDAAAVEERPNMPATTGEKHPNWSIALPEPIETLMAKPLAANIASALRNRANAVPVPSSAAKRSGTLPEGP